MPSKPVRRLVFASMVVGFLAPTSLAFSQTSVQEIVVHPVLNHGAMDTLRKQTVSYGDLDLSKKAGQHVLLTRISTAGKKVCEMDSSQLNDRAAMKSCYDGAMRSALKDLGNDNVSALYAHGG